ncbi:hypothetical protein V7150_19955 [Neobacillus drentensis]|uniref:hypothetical protein n=1 Tax=Neobacillus drentensis TaxID=220684 RepID=UPI003000C72F
MIKILPQKFHIVEDRDCKLSRSIIISSHLRSIYNNGNEIKSRWETHAEFGNPLEQYRAVQFADITENTKHITEFGIDFMLKTLNQITVFESGKLIVIFHGWYGNRMQWGID